LVLISLTEGNPEIQKLVAFENAFEQLFLIIEQEGGVDGGIVVQDCLSLLGNLLRYNSSNQVSVHTILAYRRITSERLVECSGWLAYSLPEIMQVTGPLKERIIPSLL
jgi:hypothetical protein